MALPLEPMPLIWRRGRRAGRAYLFTVRRMVSEACLGRAWTGHCEPLDSITSLRHKLRATVEPAAGRTRSGPRVREARRLVIDVDGSGPTVMQRSSAPAIAWVRVEASLGVSDIESVLDRIRAALG